MAPFTRLVVAPWPVLDLGKGLRFGKGRRNSHVVSMSKLEAVVHAHRSRENQVHRPIRIGDALWVRGKSVDPSKWESVIDSPFRTPCRSFAPISPGQELEADRGVRPFATMIRGTIAC